MKKRSLFIFLFIISSIFVFADESVPNQNDLLTKEMIEFSVRKLPEIQGNYLKSFYIISQREGLSPDANLHIPVNEIPDFIKTFAKLPLLFKLYLGEKKLGNIPLERLLVEFETVEVTVNFDKATSGVGNTWRSGAVYFPNEKRVEVNWEIMLSRIAIEGIALLYTHEFFGALGYSDLNYEATLALWFNNLIPEMALDQNLDRPLPSIIAREGGGSGVGGGGDHISFLLKMKLITNINSFYKIIEMYRDIEGEDRLSKVFKKILSVEESKMYKLIQLTPIESFGGEVKSKGEYLLDFSLCSKVLYSEITERHFLGINKFCINAFLLSEENSGVYNLFTGLFLNEVLDFYLDNKKI